MVSFATEPPVFLQAVLPGGSTCLVGLSCHLLFVGAVHEIFPPLHVFGCVMTLNVVLAVPLGLPRLVYLPGGQPGAFEKQGLLQAAHGNADHCCMLWGNCIACAGNMGSSARAHAHDHQGWLSVGMVCCCAWAGSSCAPR